MALDDTYLEDQAKARKDKQAKRDAETAELKKEYARIAKLPAFKDLEAFIEGEYITAFAAAGESVDNATAQAAYGQRAYICDKIKSYIRDMLS